MTQESSVEVNNESANVVNEFKIVNLKKIAKKTFANRFLILSNDSLIFRILITLREKCPYFPAFGLNTERYGVSLRIQYKCRKIRTRITPNTDTFHAVLVNEEQKDVNGCADSFCY